LAHEKISYDRILHERFGYSLFGQHVMLTNKISLLHNNISKTVFHFSVTRKNFHIFLCFISHNISILTYCFFLCIQIFLLIYMLIFIINIVTNCTFKYVPHLTDLFHYCDLNILKPVFIKFSLKINTCFCLFYNII